MYVLSIKRVRDTFGEGLIIPEWEYASVDNFSGCMSTGYPIFAGFHHAIQFRTPEDAQDWWNRNSQYINLSNYDKNSLAIRKMIFKTIKKIGV